MASERKQAARRLFMELADLAADQRGTALAEACGDDDALRGEVEALLRVHDQAGGFMASPTGAETLMAGGGGATVVSPEREGPGTWIGPYKILQLVGEGGFGSVFMAQQDKPVQRKVALKIIKLGMDTRQVVARFEQERQALAMMDHAHIARVLDAGATEVGRPFFVMELVKGDPIVAYCDKHRMGIQDRLRLFEQVCSAVQHAHTKGIIHRDIKPSNVLVSTQDGRPFAKVIDFGIAKATSAQLTEKTLFTEHRQLIGTPEYMSPEQAEGSLDLDTRTDVYSLGVLLYELLSGSTPFDGRSLRSAAYAEMQRIIREVDPPAPSARINQSSQTIANIAVSRQTEPKKLGAAVRGELDWIVMKALEKDRQRRYETASGLALDVKRYLDGEAVTAAPPSRAYRIRKFIRRHRTGVAAASLIGVSLVLGVVGTTVGMIQAGRQRLAAQESERRAVAEAERATKAEQEAKRRSDELGQVARFQAEQLSGIDASVMGVGLRADLLNIVRQTAESAHLSPDGAKARAEQVEKLVAGADFTGMASHAMEERFIKPGLAAIEKQFADQPLVKARLLQSLADAALRLGLHQVAVAPQKEALELRRRLLGDDDRETIDSIAAAAGLETRLTHFEEAERLSREALERKQRVYGENSREYLGALSWMALVKDKMSREEEAATLRNKAYEGARRVLGEDDPTTLDIKIGIAAKKMDTDLAEAERMFREIVESARRRYPPESNELSASEKWLSTCLGKMGRGEEAEPYARHGLELNRRYLGDDHSTTLHALNMLGWLHRQMRRYEEAERELSEAHERRRRVFGEDHQDTLCSLRNLGQLALDRQQWDKAESFARRALEGMRRRLGNGHFDTMWAESILGKALVGQKRYDEAEVYFRELAACTDRLTETSGGLAFTGTRELARLMAATGRRAEGVRLLREAHERFSAEYATGHLAAYADGARKAANVLAELYEEWDRSEPEKGHDRRAAEWRAKAAGPGEVEQPVSSRGMPETGP